MEVGQEVVVGLVDAEGSLLEEAHRARQIVGQAVADGDTGEPGQQEDRGQVEPGGQHEQSGYDPGRLTRKPHPPTPAPLRWRGGARSSLSLWERVWHQRHGASIFGRSRRPRSRTPPLPPSRPPRCRGASSSDNPSATTARQAQLSVTVARRRSSEERLGTIVAARLTPASPNP